MHVTVEAPAKVNLHLDILRKRRDGYHDLSSVMQMIGLFDTIVLRFSPEMDTLSVRGDFPIPMGKNTIERAIDVFRREIGTERKLAVEVLKMIPVGAGLGGGSSDAAAVLRALNLLFEAGIGLSELSRMGLSVGSDVPFFLESAAALIEGVGDRITALKARSDYSILLIFPGFTIHTGEAYRYYDRWVAESGTVQDPIDPRELRRFYQESRISEWCFWNAFEESTRALYPLVDEACRRILTAGALHGTVSGSGSVVFGVFESLGEAVLAKEKLQSDFPFVRVVEPLETNPNPVLQ
jgi:4-diphosphocytidyl-2-C-methyl-D-erythritol kinase